MSRYASHEDLPVRFQVLRRQGRVVVRAGRHCRRRAERVREEQRLRCHPLGAGRAKRQALARRPDGRPHFRRKRPAQTARPRRGLADLHQDQRRPADRIRRSERHPPSLPVRGKRVSAEQGPLPSARHHGPVHRHRSGRRALRPHRARQHRQRRQRPARRTPRPHRGGRRHHEVQDQAAGGGKQARGDGTKSPPHPGRDCRGRAPAEFAEAAGQQGGAVQAVGRPRHGTQALPQIQGARGPVGGTPDAARALGTRAADSDRRPGRDRRDRGLPGRAPLAGLGRRAGRDCRPGGALRRPEPHRSGRGGTPESHPADRGRRPAHGGDGGGPDRPG